MEGLLPSTLSMNSYFNTTALTPEATSQFWQQYLANPPGFLLAILLLLDKFLYCQASGFYQDEVLLKGRAVLIFI
jgi:hypothetical protein